MSVHFSSKSDEHSTPQWLFDALNSEFGFVLDAAATPANSKCPHFLTKEDDALQIDWAAVAISAMSEASA